MRFLPQTLKKKFHLCLEREMRTRTCRLLCIARGGERERGKKSNKSDAVWRTRSSEERGSLQRKCCVELQWWRGWRPCRHYGTCIWSHSLCKPYKSLWYSAFFVCSSFSLVLVREIPVPAVASFWVQRWWWWMCRSFSRFRCSVVCRNESGKINSVSRAEEHIMIVSIALCRRLLHLQWFWIMSTCCCLPL